MSQLFKWIMGFYWRRVEPKAKSRMEHQWAYANQEGVMIVSVPGDRLHGFNDLSAAILYVEAGCIKDGKELKNVLLITNKTGHA